MSGLLVLSSEVGDDYTATLKNVIAVRAHRRKIYGDSWKLQSIEHDAWMCYSKVNRILYQLGAEKNNYENLEDSIIDLCNYCLFLLYKIKKN